MDDISDIRDMYDAMWDREDDRLRRHQLEHDITWRFLDPYLPASGHILDIGAGTGRYSLQLARRGYRVLAVDLAPHLVARARQRASQEGLGDRVEFRVGDARHLPNVAEATFDVALLMGPLYHLVLREDRLAALNQAYACLKSGGVLFSAWLSRFGIVGNVLKVNPGIIHEEAEVSAWLDRGQESADHGRARGDFPRAYAATVEEIAPLHTESGFQMLALAGVEPAISADDESYNRLEGEMRRRWLDLLFRISTEPSMVASSRHMLYVGRRPAKS